jgi:hypothetical protein
MKARMVLLASMGRSPVLLTVLACAIVTLALWQPAAAQSDAETKRAMGEVAGELQQCSVYFLVMSACFEPQEPDLARTLREQSNKVGTVAISVGRSVGVTDEAYAALAKLESEAMMKSMNGNCINVAVPMNKYMNFCKRLSQNGDQRLKEWIACAHASQPTCGGGP